MLLLKNCHEFYEYVRDSIEKLNAARDNWAKLFADDPYDVLSNCDNMFMVVATLSVMQAALKACEGGKATYESFTAFAKREVLVRSENFNNSTSVSKNLLRRCELAAWADMLQTLEGHTFMTE
jgi:hypothetical protein